MLGLAGSACAQEPAPSAGRDPNNDAGAGGDGGAPSQSGGAPSVEPDAAPVAEDDDAVTARGVTVIIDVTANDREVVEAAVISSFTDGQHGTVLLTADGSLRYLPDPDFDGEDAFDYVLSDGRSESSTATVSVLVLPRYGTVVDGRLYAGFDTSFGNFPSGLLWADMNSAGQRLGRTPDFSKAFIRETGGTLTDIPFPAELTSLIPRAINDAGTVTGFGEDDDGNTLLFNYSSGQFNFWASGFESYTPDGIDSDGNVVGFVYLDEAPAGYRGFIRASDGAMQTLQRTPGVDTVFGGISPSGLITGHTGFSEGAACFVRLESGVFEDFAARSGAAPYAMRCNAINDARVAVGTMQETETTRRGASLIDARGSHRFHFPFRPAPGATSRTEALTGIDKDGNLVGTYLESVDGETIAHAVDFIPVAGKPNTSFIDTPFGFVESN